MWGRALADLGDPAGAEARMADALRIARVQGARMFELRAACDMAALSGRPDQQACAHADLEEIYASFTQGFEEPDLVRARSLLGGDAG